MMLLLLASPAHAFCGTYVGPLGSALSNDAAQVVLARSGTTTTLTLANDVSGDTQDFALVIPVPEVLTAEDVKVVENSVFDVLDAYSAPRVVSYTCDDFYYDSADSASESSGGNGGDADGVTVESSFQVGEYDIVVLSASGGDALLSWLEANGFSVSEEMAPVLDEYVAAEQFFVAAKVHLDVFPDGSFLSPLQFTYQSEMWSLPIRIGTTVSGGEQQVVVYALTDTAGGQTSISNYPEATLEDECMFPEGEMDYEGYFQTQLDVAFSGDGRWLTEYAWPTSGCDPCSSDPPSAEVLASLGASWDDVFLTRLRVRYTPEQATQDLVLYGSGIYSNEQLRYIQYADYLEDVYPVCGAEILTDGGSCEDYGYSDDDGEGDADTGPKSLGDNTEGECGCSAVNPGAWAWLVGLAALVRRRSPRLVTAQRTP